MFVTSLLNFKRVFIGKCKSFSTSNDTYIILYSLAD